MNKYFNIKGLTIISLLILNICIIALIIHDFKRNKLDRPISYPINENILKDTNSIGIIGDSWVANKKLDESFKLALKAKGLNYNIISFGEPGAKTQKIYQNLMSPNQPNTSHGIITNPPKFCILINGINDAAGVMKPEYYSHYTIQIIQALLKRKIKPILLELPEFGLNETIDQASLINKTKNTLLSWSRGQSLNETINTYRKTLKEKLISEHIMEDIIYIPYHTICGDYKKCLDLYKDQCHLNKKGIELLNKEIVKSIDNN